MLQLFKRSESLIAVDVGAASLKVIELDLAAKRPVLKNLTSLPTIPDLFNGNVVSKADKLAELIANALESNEIEAQRVATAMPGPSVFTKKIQVPRMSLTELRETIAFEAGNYIPHSIDDVKLDYQVLRPLGKQQLEVLLVAVKNEVIDTYLEAITLAGLECAIADVDFFALQNIFEHGYPEMVGKTVALVHIGARFSVITIVRDGMSLVSGNVSIGGRALTDTIVQDLGVSLEEAEGLKKGAGAGSPHATAVHELIDVHSEYVAAELNRQIGFFWNTSGEEGGIDAVYISGGGSMVPRLAEELKEKTGIETHRLDPFRGFDIGESFDAAYLVEIGPSMTICAGLALRQLGDKVAPDYD